MARTVEIRLQKFFGNRKRFNEIDPRFLTRDIISPDRKISAEGIIKFPYRLMKTAAIESLYEVWRHTKGKGKRVKKPVFLIGMPHSGTGIARDLFAVHPALANKSEAETILQPMGYFDYENGDQALLEKHAVEEEIERLHCRFSFYTWLLRGQRLFNKNPTNTVRIPFLAKIFPDAYFLHILRDGRAVVSSLVGLSLNKQDWEKDDKFKPWQEREDPFPGVKPPHWRSLLRDNPLEQYALQWREVIHYVLETEKSCNVPCCHFRYEEMCANPKKVIGELWQFCGLPATDRALALLPEKLENRNYKWQRDMTKEQKAFVTNIQQPLLKSLKYI